MDSRPLCILEDGSSLDCFHSNLILLVFIDRYLFNKGHVDIYEVDLSSLASVKKCCQEILEKESKIDFLINNAGIMMCPYEKTVDGFEKQFATNHLGHFLLNELLMPLVYKAAKISKDKARIVITSSIAHKFGNIRWHDLNSTQNYNSGSAYAQSKLANVLYANALARKLKVIYEPKEESLFEWAYAQI